MKAVSGCTVSSIKIVFLPYEFLVRCVHFYLNKITDRCPKRLDIFSFTVINDFCFTEYQENVPL